MKERLTGLDGLRAIAALLIVLGHCSQEYFSTWGGKPLTATPYLPQGVLCIFFVLSGFMFGLAGNKTDNIKEYWGKRLKRILPPYYIYIAAVIISYLILGQSGQVINKSLIYYILPLGIIPFCSNGAIEGIVSLTHLWFITAILFFYLIAPIVKKISGNRFERICIILAIFIALAKWAIYFTLGKDTFIYRFIAASQLDATFLGAYLGCKHLNTNHVIGIGAGCLFLLNGFYAEYIPATVRSEVIALTVAVAVIYLSGQPLISFKGNMWQALSRASYDIYLWHILVIYLFSRAYNALISTPRWDWRSRDIPYGCNFYNNDFSSYSIQWQK